VAFVAAVKLRDSSFFPDIYGASLRFVSVAGHLYRATCGAHRKPRSAVDKLPGSEKGAIHARQADGARFCRLVGSENRAAGIRPTHYAK
jgi:hypothetical protein